MFPNTAKICTRYTFRCMKTRYFNSNYEIKNFHRCCIVTSEATLTAPNPSNIANKEFPPKIQAIVNDISKLTILEVSDLNQLLKKTLNIPDAPVMAMGYAPAAPVEKEEEQAPVSAKSSFTIKLTKYDESKKINLIKEIKNVVEGLNLVQAKKFVESLPQVIKADISKDEVEKIQKSVEAAGGIVVID